MKVRDVMRTPVITISESATISEAVALLKLKAVSGLPVVNSANEIVGIVTEHDIMKFMLPTYDDLLSADEAILNPHLIESRVYDVKDQLIRDVMNPNVITVTEDNAILKAAASMILKNIKRLPVIQQGKPIGIVSRIDIVYALIHQSQSES